MISFTRDDVFLVTGASSGFGKAVTLKLNELGSTVIGISRSAGRLKEAFKKAQNADRLIVMEYDLANTHNDIPKMVRQLAKEYGSLKGLVHCAGVLDLVPLSGFDPEKARKLFELNYFAALALAKGFSRKGVYRQGASSVVFLSSATSIMGQKGVVNYSGSKGALNSATKSMALELAPKGIRVNAVLPAHISTSMADSVYDVYSKKYKEELQFMYPLGPGTPDDVANLLAFLLSDRARWITGQNIVIDGGRCLL